MRISLDEAVATFKRELPNWWWSITECWVSIHGECAPDWTPGYSEHPDRGIKAVELEIDKPSGPRGKGGNPDPTPAEFIMMLLEKAKTARAAHAPGAEGGAPNN